MMVNTVTVKGILAEHKEKQRCQNFTSSTHPGLLPSKSICMGVSLKRGVFHHVVFYFCGFLCKCVMVTSNLYFKCMIARKYFGSSFVSPICTCMSIVER